MKNSEGFRYNMQCLLKACWKDFNVPVGLHVLNYFDVAHNFMLCSCGWRNDYCWWRVLVVRGCIPYGQCFLSPPECYTDFDVEWWLTRKWKPVLSSNLKPPQLSVFCGFWECSQSCRPYCRPTALHACVTHGLYCTRIDFIGVSSIKVLISRPRLLSDHLPDRYFVINDNYFILFLTRKIRSSICSFMHAF